ncbi:MAG: response regulator [Gammaproteobacteria bacterium]|nr:response regulator [Gammaproteobacteria bacterium]
MNILIVDDEEYMLTMLKESMESDTRTLFFAENIADAWSIINNETIDLVITDLVMPEVNGIDFIIELKKTNDKLPVIAMSGGGGINGRFDYLSIAKLIGAKHILEKPFDIFKLISLVDETMAC